MTSSTITIAPAVRARLCPLCGAAPGRPCQPKPVGDHLARHLDAYTAAAITRELIAAVVGGLVVVDACAVIEGDVRAEGGKQLEPVTADDAARYAALQLAEGERTITYAPDRVWHGVWCDLRERNGQVVESGFGQTQDLALADMLRRLGGAR